MHKRKHQFHCNHCGLPCEIYRKGKGHRILVCPHCGVLATNPTLAGSILKGAVSGIPIVGGALSGVIGGIQEHKDQTRAQPSPSGLPRSRPIHDKGYYEYKEHMLKEALN